MTPPLPRTRPLEECLVSVLLPVYNEAQVLPRLCAGLVQALLECGACFEIVFVNDGSTDGTAEILDALADGDRRVRVVHFSRNFGHQAAVQAGLAHTAGDAVVVMDSDMQDDPRAIGAFLREWQAGWDVVYAIRTGRKEGPVKRLLFHAFYRLLARVSEISIPMDAGNFGLIDARIVREIRGLADADRYYPGLRSWVGFRQKGIAVERQARYDEKPRVSLPGLCRLAKSAVFSFSRAPLALFYAIAAAAGVVFALSLGFTLYHRLVTGLAVPGWTSMTITASFFGALNALGVAVLGEYTVRIYDQVRGRPQYVVDRRRNFRLQDDERIEPLLDWLEDRYGDSAADDAAAIESSELLAQR
ncbi:MAG: glycosyltransferase family 2 protein [Planctomycetes bacterium]|nr:glycosyltransferase family 2 protein [Planctomycetota bacterium]